MARIFSSIHYIHRLELFKHLRRPLHSSVNVTYNSKIHGKSLNHNELDRFKKDEVLQGFIVDEVSKVDEMYLTAVRLTHLSTGAQYLHLARDDSNNVFSIGFRTTPMDSTGLPHILEHTTLCGSERYPCRDPFFKMYRRSLATFMNAMTAPDYTIYPFSTQNLKDFRNLQSVYLDSVFKPNLREVDFCQEGWRLEHSNVDDKNSPIIFKGVVFNEMKGVFNENQAILAERLLNSILPSHTYAVISGGDPLVIPNLKHSDLINFHANYYHPSNSRFYSYGNFPLEDHLKFINDQYLFLAGRIDVSKTKVPSEKRWTSTKKEHINCRPDPMIADSSRQGTIAIGHLCNDITDIQRTLEMNVLSQLLLRGPNSAFYKSLIESNIGTGFSPLTGFDPQCKDTMFVVSLQGVKAEDFEKVERIFNETVTSVIEQGFKQDHIEAVLHGIELQVKHQSSNFGLHLLFHVSPLWNHDGNVIQSLKINEAVKTFREEMKRDSKYLQKLVEKYLLNNTHRLTLTMLPDENYDQMQTAAEQELLQKKLDELSQDEIEQIYENGKILLAEQQKIENVDVLPTLKIEDLKEDVDRYEVTNLNVSNIPLQISVQPTNGICYYRAIINTQGLPNSLRTLVPLFNMVIAKMGTQNYDYRNFDEMIHLKTGGLGFTNHVVEHKSNQKQYEEGIFIESYCLDRNVNDMWKLWTELFNNVKLDSIERFGTLVKLNAAQLVNGIANAGHIYAMSTAASLVSPTAKLKESMSGLQYIGRMKEIAQIQDLTPILKQIKEISKYVLHKNHLRSAINLSEDHKDDILKSVNTFYQTLPNNVKGQNIIPRNESDIVQETGIHYVLPYTVNYTSKVILTVPYTDPEFAVLRILSRLITSIYLHPEIREKGGAYGGGAKLTSEGIFTFYSYRDPNSIATFDVFDKIYDFLLNYSLLQNEIDEAKLGVFQQIDAPTSPSNRGMNKFIYGITDDDVQRHREQLKAVTKEQLMHTAEKYLKPGQPNLNIGRCLIGPTNSELINKRPENWIILDQEEKGQTQNSNVLNTLTSF